MLRLAILAVALQCAAATNYYWAGTNTDFANVTNWSGGVRCGARTDDD